MKLILAQTAIITANIFVSPAFSETYKCDLQMKRSGGNWMGPTIYVDYDRSTGKAKIIDGVIDHYMGSPVVTSKIAESAKKISFKYKLGDVKGSATNASGVSYANQSYRLSIFKPSMKAVITMTPLGYSNTFRDTGRCQIKD